MNLAGIKATPQVAQQRAADLLKSLGNAAPVFLSGHDLARFKTAHKAATGLCSLPAAPSVCCGIETALNEMADVFFSSQVLNKKPAADVKKIRISFDIVIYSCKNAGRTN